MLCSLFYLSGQTDTLVFQKRSKKQELFVPLPHHFNITTKKNENKYGTAFSQTDSTICLSYHVLDSVKASLIEKNPLISKKAKRQKLDSLFDADSIVYSINKHDISRVDFGIYKIRPRKHQAVFWASTSLFVASGLLFITVLSGTPNPSFFIRLIQVIPYPLTLAMSLYSGQKRIRVDKWEIK